MTDEITATVTTDTARSHEDNVLIARAALLGVRFERSPEMPGWRDVGGKYIKIRMFTLGRAAAHMLARMGEMSNDEYRAYLARTEGQHD